MGKRNSFKIASIYIGTVIGAGFASGQEMVQFFGNYGLKGVYGVVVAGFLFGIIGSLILINVHKHRVLSYSDWLRPLFGKPIQWLVEAILTILLISWYCVMLAGSGALFQEQLGFTKESGIWFMTIITFITFLFSMKGLAFINEMLVPVLILGIIVLGGLVIVHGPWDLSNEVGVTLRVNTGNWLTSSLLYVSYNSIGAAMVMSSLYPLINNRGTAIGGGFLGGIGLGVMAFFLLIPILILYTDVQGVEIPMMAIASKFGHKARIIYGGLLWFAMLTTAIANGFVVIQSMERKFNLNHMATCLVFCLITNPLAGFGFKTLVSTLYPLFGYIGLILFIVALYRRVGLRN